MSAHLVEKAKETKEAISRGEGEGERGYVLFIAFVAWRERAGWTGER